MSSITSQTVLKGSVILLTANFIVKLIGAIFKIPLVNLLGNEGMAYFNAAYTIYSGLFVIATAGLPVALSKMIAESRAKGNLFETKRIFKVAFTIFISIGILGSLTLFFGAEKFANMTNFASSDLCVKAMAPAIFFVALMSVYRGFFQGMSNMYPTAISEVVESLCKLIIGYALAYMLFEYGLRIASAGAVAGVTIGTGIGFLTLLSIYIFRKNSIYAGVDSSIAVRSYRRIFAEMLKIAVPITISASVFTLTTFIDTMIVGSRLRSIEHLLSASREVLYGMYTGKAVTMYNMPPTLVTALCLSLVPAIAGAYAMKNWKVVQKTTLLSLKTTILFALPAAVGMGVMAAPILQLLFSTTDAALLLSLLSPAIFFVSMVMVTNAILQSTGNVMIPLVNIGVAAVIKIVINYVLVGNPAINILGAPVGTSVCYFLYMVLNLYFVIKVTKIRPRFSDFLFKPAFAAGVMGAVAYLSYHFIWKYVSTFGRGGIALSLACAMGLATLVYGFLLLKTDCIKAEEISALPMGAKIAAVLHKIGILRS